ncbi:MAG: RHS repeat protein, partial [Oscillospiraceae bacterium]|nr:RHS repeat protein [Oscillospiraceae bacterium]
MLAGKEISAFAYEDLYAADYSHMKFGKGWQLSVQESVIYRSSGSNLVYRDSDGTLHYFSYVSGSTYVDEDGLGLKLVRYADGPEHTYRLTDQTGNIKFFYHNMLTYMADGNGNRIYFVYNGKTYSSSSNTWRPTGTDDKLTQIVAVNKGQDAEVICTLAYNSSNQLSKITDYAERETLFTYTNGNLTKVTHPDGTAAHYAYDSNGQLIRMYDDEADYGIEYGYDADGICAIHEYTAASINGAQTRGVQIQREKNGIQEVRYRYDGNDRAFETADDIVNCYYFDYAGRTINAVTLDTNMTNILGVTSATYTSTEDASKNKIEKTAQSGQNGVNMLSAGGVEEHRNYAPSSADWVKISTDDNFNAVIKGNEVARTGAGSLKTWIGYGATGNATREDENDTKRIAIYQTKWLEEGTYTVSAYVNTQGIQKFDPYGGSYVAIMNSNNEVLSIGNKVSHVTSNQIDNGWLRVYATFECDIAGNYRIAAVQDNAYGHSYFDDLQLEEGNVPSNVNLLQNGSFTKDTDEWNAGSFSTADGGEHHGNVLRVDGAPDKNCRLSQIIPIGGSCVDQTFLLSGWGKALSAADCKADLGWKYSEHIVEKNDERYFGLIAQLHYRDSNNKPHSQYFYAPFNDDFDEWQFASCVIVPGKYNQDENMTLESIEVYAVYDNNFNTMFVDNLSLRKEPCTTYTYNTNGNVEGITATSSSVQSVKYLDDGVRPTTVHKSDDEAYIYYYGASNKYLPTQITNYETGAYTRYTYDPFGNITMTENAQCIVSNGQRVSEHFLKSNAEYSDDGSQLKSETDVNGQTIYYSYNNYRDLTKTTYENGMIVETEENVANDRPYASYISDKIYVYNTYTKGLLSKIERDGYIPGNTEKQKQYYNMAYDNFGNMTAVSIGANATSARILASYSYGPTNNHLDSMTYGNGDSITYTYDNLDRMTKETWDDGTSYLYMYNAEGALAQKVDATDQTKVDNGTASAVNYEYDSLGRLIYSSASENGETIVLTEHLYDRQNRIDKQTYQLRNTGDTFTTYISDYIYRATDGVLTYVDSVNGNFGDYAFEYDDIARLSARYNYYFRQDYDYLYVKDGLTTTETTSQASAQIGKIDYSARPGGTQFSPFSLVYTYDALGNIKTITGTGISGQNASYVYDVQSQLTSAVVDGKNYSYEYDTYGNIRKAVENGTTHTYSYGDADWKDLLTAYDSQSITYDEIGNPTSYYNGTRWDFDWEKGRQLVEAESGSYNIEYAYDMAGIRESKVVKTVVDNQETEVTYNYLTLDGKVVRQTWEDAEGSHVFDIIYDNSGLPYAFKYAGGYYIYVLNQQGDVIRIVNGNGATVAEYKYDAWGNLLVDEDDLTEIGRINPIRYRGYYYDTETGFYYLQSRYYDPSIGRFINADSFASTGQGFVGYNVFAYC